MPDRTPLDQPSAAPANPPPLVVATSIVSVQGVVLVGLAVAGALHVVGERAAVGLATAFFFLLYGAALLFCAHGLTRRHGWVRGPVLLTQLIQLGIAWNVRDSAVVAIVLAVSALVALAAMLHPASVAALFDEADSDT